MINNRASGHFQQGFIVNQSFYNVVISLFMSHVVCMTISFKKNQNRQQQQKYPHGQKSQPITLISRLKSDKFFKKQDYQH